MTERELGDLAREVQRAADTLISLADKVIQRNPTWNELPKVLSQDEIRMMSAFLRATLGTPLPERPPYRPAV